MLDHGDHDRRSRALPGWLARARWACVLGVTLAAACHPADAVRARVTRGQPARDVAVPPPPEAAAAIRARREQRRLLRDDRPTIVFLNFDGATIKPGADSNSQTNTSYLTQEQVELPAFDGAAFGLPRDGAIATVVAHLRDIFGGFDVVFVTDRPQSGEYTMAMIGGRANLLGQEPGVLGLAPQDCQGGEDFQLNLNHSDIAFVFSDDAGGDGLDLMQLAFATAHELGHAFGLGHVTRSTDIMYSDLDGSSSRSWGASPLADGDKGCDGTGFQDDFAFLWLAVGHGYPLKPKPEVAITAPGDHTVMDGPVSVSVTASAETVVTGVELWINGSWWAGLQWGPWSFAVPELPPGVYALRARATDPYNTATSEAVSVFVPQPVFPCRVDAECGDRWRCRAGACVSPPPSPRDGDLGAACESNDDCVSGRCVSAEFDYCSRACRDDVGAYCPVGYACGGDGYCASATRVSPGGPGAPCQRAGECQFGLCVGAAGEGHCSKKCTVDGAACPGGAECVPDTGSVDGVCGRPRAGACSVAQTGRAPAVALWSAALLAFARRCRRRRIWRSVSPGAR